MTSVTVIVLTLVSGSNSNFSFSNLISNYLTKYPSNVHNRHQKQFNQKPPLPPSHHQQSKISRQALGEVSRAFQPSSLAKRNLKNKGETKAVAQRNLIQQPVRIKLPDIINRQQNVNIRPWEKSYQRHEKPSQMSMPSLPLRSPIKFENMLNDVQQKGEIRMRLPLKFKSLNPTDEQKTEAKTDFAIFHRNLLDSTMSRNQKTPPFFTDSRPAMQEVRFQGKDKPIFITKHNSGMTQNQKTIGSLAKGNQITNFQDDADFYNHNNSSNPSNRFEKYSTTHFAKERKPIVSSKALRRIKGDVFIEVSC